MVAVLWDRRKGRSVCVGDRRDGFDYWSRDYGLRDDWRGVGVRRDGVATVTEAAVAIGATVATAVPKGTVAEWAVAETPTVQVTGTDEAEKGDKEGELK